MPELPEVETIARQLRRLVVGRTIRTFAAEWERLTEPLTPPRFGRRLVGRRIVAVSRRGKLVRSALFENCAFLVSQHMAAFGVTGKPLPPMSVRVLSTSRSASPRQLLHCVFTRTPIAIVVVPAGIGPLTR